MTDEHKRLEQIAETHDLHAATAEQQARAFSKGSAPAREKAATARAHRRAASIIRHQIECEA